MAKWAGEDLAKKRGFFRASAIPSGLAPWQFYLGLGLLFVSNFGVFGLVVVERLNPGGGLLSAVNAFTDIANAAMEEKIRSGEIAPWAGTVWSYQLWADLISQYMQAGSTPQEFVTEWCSSDESRTSICLTAKAVAEARIGAGPSMCMPSGGEEEDEDETPWWRRPPRTWPPRVDDTRLILGDVLAVYGAAFVALSALATPDDRASASVMMAWPSEGGAMATAWIVGAAVTNAWDPTAVLPSLGLSNALACTARASVDYASTFTLLSLVSAAVAHRAVNVTLLALELALGGLAVAVWRAVYMNLLAGGRGP